MILVANNNDGIAYERETFKCSKDLDETIEFSYLDVTRINARIECVILVYSEAPEFTKQ